MRRTASAMLSASGREGRPAICTPHFAAGISTLTARLAATAAAMGTLTPAPCTPATPASWVPGAATVQVCGKPLLNNTSKLMCAYGGVIQLTMTPAVTVQTP